MARRITDLAGQPSDRPGTRPSRDRGAEIEQIDRSELVARIDDLETVIAKLRSENNDLVETNTRRTQLAAQQHDDLDTADTLLRRYMKEASRAQAKPI